MSVSPLKSFACTWPGLVCHYMITAQSHIKTSMTNNSYSCWEKLQLGCKSCPPCQSALWLRKPLCVPSDGARKAHKSNNLNSGLCSVLGCGTDLVLWQCTLGFVFWKQQRHYTASAAQPLCYCAKWKCILQTSSFPLIFFLSRLKTQWQQGPWTLTSTTHCHSFHGASALCMHVTSPSLSSPSSHIWSCSSFSVLMSVSCYFHEYIVHWLCCVSFGSSSLFQGVFS